MKHKHAEMIKAKADNMDLVVLCSPRGYWYALTTNVPGFFLENNYFLCLPKHKEVCLHWLNGGDIQYLYDDRWIDVPPASYQSSDWNSDSAFMSYDVQLRIKPKKVKRWIAIEKGKCNPFYYKEKEAADRVYPNADQYIQIEVEL